MASAAVASHSPRAGAGAIYSRLSSLITEKIAGIKHM